MTTGPPPFPPGGSAPPVVPEGWNAQWSGEHKAWYAPHTTGLLSVMAPVLIDIHRYFFNQATQTSTWENPANRAPVPPSPPPYASASNPPNRDLYDVDDDKSTTARGFSPLYSLGNVFHHHSHSPPINSSTRPHNNGQLYIHAAGFGDQDITSKVRSMVTQQQTLSIRSDALTYHFGDPWPNHRKQFALLYSYGQQPWQLVVCMEGNDTINLHPVQPVDRMRAEFVQQPTSRVVALVWGVKNALAENEEHGNGRSVGMKMMEVEREGRLEASNNWMGFDGNPNVEKMAMVFYRNGDGSVGVLTAREGETLRLPWNAFAGAI